MALSVALGQLTAPAATGSQSYTVGAGVQPKAILLFHAGIATAANTNLAGAHGGYGVSDGTNQWGIGWGATDQATTSVTGQDFRTTACIVILSAGDPVVAGVASLTAFTATGFTLNWTAVTGISGALVRYIAWYGSDITNVLAGVGTFPITNGSAAGPTHTFQPDAVILCGAYNLATPTSSAHSHSPIGYAANYQGTISQASAQYFDQDNNSTMSMSVGTSTTAALITNATVPVTTPITAVVTAFTATGFTLNWTQTGTTANMRYGFLSFKGGTYRVVTETAATTNTTLTKTGVGFTPTGALVAATGQTAAGTLITGLPSNTAALSIGVVGGGAQGGFTSLNFDGHATSQGKRRLHDSTIGLERFTSAVATQPAVVGNKGYASFTLQSDGWVATWTLTDGTAHLYSALLFGDAPSGTPQALAAVVAGVSTVAGALTVNRGLQAVAAGVSTAAANLTITAGTTAHALAAVVTGASTVAGALTVAHPVQAVSAGVSAVAGALTVAHPVQAGVAGVSTVAGALRVVHPLQALVAAVSAVGSPGSSSTAYAFAIWLRSSTTAGVPLTVTGTGPQAHALVATVASASTAAAVLTVTQAHALVATVAGVSTVATVLTVAHPLQAVVDSTSTVAGALMVLRPLQAAVTSESTVAGSVTVVHPLIAVVAGVSTAASDLIVTHPLLAVVAAQSTTAGVLTVVHPLQAIVTGVATVDGALRVVHPLQAVVAGVSTLEAAMTMQGQQVLRADVAIVSTIAGALTVVHPLQAVVANVSTVAALATLDRRLAALVAGQSTAAAALLINRGLAAAVAANASVAAHLVYRAALRAAIDAQANLTANLTNTPLAGTPATVTFGIRERAKVGLTITPRTTTGGTIHHG